MRTGVYFQKNGNRLFLFYNLQSPIFAAMFRFFFFAVWLFPTLWANARISEEDTMQINQLLTRAGSFANLNPDSAIRYYQAAQEQSEFLKYPEGVAKAKVGKAEILLGQNIASSIALAKEVLDICEEHKMGNLQASAEARMLLASAYEEQGRSDSSAYYYYLLMQQIENGLDVPPSFAIRLYTKLAIFLLNSYSGIKGSREYGKLLSSYVARAKNSAELMENREDAISSTYFLQAAYFHGTEQYDSAVHYYKSYLHERQKLGLISWQRKASTYLNIAESYLDQDKPSEAVPFIMSAKELLKSPTAIQYSQYFDAFADLILARAFHKLRKHSESVELIENALKRLSSVSDRTNLNVAEGYLTASSSYEALGNLPQALQYKKMYLNLHDSLLKREQLSMINGMELRYRLVEKDKELAESKLAVAASSQKVRNRNMLIGMSAFLILIGVALWLIWSRKNMHKEKFYVAEMESLQRKLEIERLNATLNGEEMERNRIARELHDGVGGLLSAAKMNFELFGRKNQGIDRNDLNDGILLLQQASSELRKTAHNLMPETLLHEGLLKAIQNYCASLSGKNSPVIQVQFLGELVPFPAQFEFSVYRIVQELVHNMVRHSGATEGLVELNFREDGGLSLTIEDNGVGLPQAVENNKSKDGIGLRNVRERLKAINGGLDIRSIPGKGAGFYIDFDPITQNNPVTI